jgi:hypothetical protein
MPWWMESRQEDGSIEIVRTYDMRDLADAWQVKTSLGEVTVSTMFNGAGPRAYYETMVIGTRGSLDGPVAYEAREDAEEGHRVMVRKWRKLLQGDLLDSVKEVVHINNEYRAVDEDGNTLMVLSEEGARKASTYLRMRRESREHL